MESLTSSVPFIDITRYEPGFLEELLPRVEGLIRKGQFVGGAVTRECESCLKKVTGAAHAIVCANGTDALQIALRSVGVGPEDKVLLPDMTFWATFEAIVNVGARPVTVDVDLNTLHLSTELLGQALDQYKPKAVLMVHLYGWAAPQILDIRKLCKERGVALVEDCAQALGVEVDGQSLIAGASVATTSFYPAKVLGASGDAGAVFCADESVAQRARSLSDHGRSDHYAHAMVGWNSRMGAFEATFLILSSQKLKERITSRLNSLALYRKELKDLNFAKFLAPEKNVLENGYASVIWVDLKQRDALLSYLTEQKIGCRIIYPGAMSHQPGADDYLAGNLSHGNASQISKQVLSLPLFAYMRDSEVSRVVDVVRKFQPV